MNIFAFSMALTLSLLASLLVLGAWIWALVDVIKSNKETNEKIIWILILVLLNIVGVLIYYIMKDKKVKNKQLKKSKDNKVLAGVCGGLGEYFEIDPTIIRLLWVLLTVFSIGTGIFLYIVAAIIIPGHPQQKTQEKTQKNGAVAIILAIAAVFIVLIISVSIVAIVGFNHYWGGASVSQTVQKSISFENEIAEKVARDFITSHHNYLNHSGNNLFCHTIMETDEEICDQYNDPYGVQIRNPECFEVLCKFDSAEDGIRGYAVEAIVVGDRVKRVGFHEVTEQKLPEELSQITKEKMPEEREKITHEISTESDCENAGYEVLYPDLKGGPLQCHTDDGVINISSDICVDMCGDGTCQAIVCTGSGCPCAETSSNCPADCK
ncbi:MAG: PspC domain-containing protein [Candidatus Woesearchaeota archaeon]